MNDYLGMTPAIAPVKGISAPTAGGSSIAGGQASPTGAGGDFGSMLSSLLNGTIENVRAGEQAAVDGLTGKMPLQDVVNKVLTAEQSLQAAIAVRDKIVAAYLEVSRMSI